MAGRVGNWTFRLLAGIALLAYWIALSVAGARAGLHLLWVYPLLGALLWTYAGTNDALAVGILVLGAVLPPLLMTGILMFTPHPDNTPDGEGVGGFIALAWGVTSLGQVFVLGLARLLMDWIEERFAR